ncbi:MAG: LytTR family transcriptional regulator DNA-binding domain-containing protein [Bacteroidota bacterium]
MHRAVQPYLVRSLMACEPVEIIFIRVRLWDHRLFERLERMPILVFLCGGKDKLTDKLNTSVPYRLREPYTVTKIEQLVCKLSKERITESPSYFFVRFEGQFHKLCFLDIVMIERMQMNYVKIWAHHVSMLVPGTLTQWLSKLPQGQFIRVSDTLVLPLKAAMEISSDEYVFRGRNIQLTYRFASAARKEMELQTNWI